MNVCVHHFWVKLRWGRGQKGYRKGGVSKQHLAKVISVAFIINISLLVHWSNYRPLLMLWVTEEWRHLLPHPKSKLRMIFICLSTTRLCDRCPQIYPYYNRASLVFSGGRKGSVKEAENASSTLKWTSKVKSLQSSLHFQPLLIHELWSFHGRRSLGSLMADLFMMWQSNFRFIDDILVTGGSQDVPHLLKHQIQGPSNPLPYVQGQMKVS